MLLDAIDELARKTKRTRSDVMRRLMCEALGISWDESDSEVVSFPPIEVPGDINAS